LYATLASALALLGKREEAKIALDNLLKIKPDFSLNDIPVSYSPLNPDAVLPLFGDVFDGLRKAGLDAPED
jgi:hypothetical protein